MSPPPAPRPVVVVHGLWMPGAETLLLRRRLAAAGFAPRMFHYASVRAGLDANSEALAAFVDGLGTRGVGDGDVPGSDNVAFGNDRGDGSRATGIDFVGHSLGGAVVLTMLERCRPELDARVVCLGSPLKGSRSAERLARLPGGARILGRSMADLVARGGFERWSGPQPVGVVAGTLSLSFGRLLGRLPGPNDGTVEVEETRLAGADHIVVRASHTSLLVSRPAAAEMIHFLRHAVFSESARKLADAKSGSNRELPKSGSNR